MVVTPAEQIYELPFEAARPFTGTLPRGTSASLATARQMDSHGSHAPPSYPPAHGVRALSPRSRDMNAEERAPRQMSATPTAMSPRHPSSGTTARGGTARRGSPYAASWDYPREERAINQDQ